MDRSAVAATIVSAVVFSTVLLANTALYAAQNGYLAAVQHSSAQVEERGLAPVLSGEAAFSSLAGTQTFLQSHPMDCLDPQPYLHSLSGSADQGGKNQSVWYSAHSSWEYTDTASVTAGDVLIPKEFDGFAPANLDLLVLVSVNESFAGGLPSYSLQRAEMVHLPVEPEVEAARCQAALADLRSALSSLASCDSASISQKLSSLTAGSSALGPFSVSASATSSFGVCAVTFSVSSTQGGVPGVLGPFEWTVHGSGSEVASVSGPPQPPTFGP